MKTLAAVILLISTGADEPSVGVDQLWETFRERESALGTVEVVWTKKLIQSPRVYAGDPDVVPPPTADLVLPPDQFRLILDGPDRARLEGSLLSFASGDSGAPVPSTLTFDGKHSWRFNDRSTAGQPGQGSISESHGLIGRGSVHLWPIWAAARPLWDGAFGPDQSAWRVAGREEVDGRTCMVLKKNGTPSAKGAKQTVWIDASALVPLRTRFESITGNSHRVQVDMDYSEGDKPSWFPASWRVVVHSGQGNHFLEQSDNQMASVQAAVPVSDDTFRIEFPPGTMVMDGREKRGGAVPAIVDSTRAIVPERQQVSREAGKTDWVVVSLGAIGVGVLSAAAFAWRRRK